MFQDALKGPRLVGIIQPNQLATENEGLYRIGGGGIIMAFNCDKNGMTVLLRGIGRFTISNHMTAKSGYRRAVVSWQQFPDDLKAGNAPVPATKIDKLRKVACGIVPHYEQLLMRMDGEQLVNFLAMGLDFGANEKQALLEAPKVDGRAELLLQLVEMKKQQEVSQQLH